MLGEAWCKVEDGHKMKAGYVKGGGTWSDQTDLDAGFCMKGCDFM
jgi:hypothetical protein